MTVQDLITWCRAHGVPLDTPLAHMGQGAILWPLQFVGSGLTPVEELPPGRGMEVERAVGAKKYAHMDNENPVGEWIALEWAHIPERIRR